MTKKNIQAIVLAGGLSERFQTGKTKLVEKICGKAMIVYPLQLLKKLSIPTSLVVGFQQEKIQNVINQTDYSINIINQKEALGSGHAASLTKHLWTEDHILLMGADIPLLTEDIITKLYKKHIKTDADISFITAHGLDVENKNYCRIVINDNKIHVLDHSSSPEELDSQCCVSGGVYIAKKSFLEKYIDQLTKGNLSNEYYLPELVKIASEHNCKIVTAPVSMDAIRCVDTLSDLWAVEHIKRSQLIQHWMKHGVRFTNALNVMIDEDVLIEPGAYISSGAHLLGKTVIKKNANIGAYAFIKNSTIDERASIKSHTVITNSTIKADSVVLPFTHIDHQSIVNPISSKTNNPSQTFTGAIKTKHVTNQQDL